jgi:hypothetical protein
VARKLTAGVVLHRPGSGGASVFLPSGSELPGWAVSLIGDHVLTPADTAEWRPDPEGADWPDLDETEPASSWPPPVSADPPPPKSGPGSGRPKWEAYAIANSVTVHGSDSRDDIIAACVLATVPTD